MIKSIRKSNGENMIEVTIKHKLKEKQFISLFKFIHSIASEVCFTCFHDYYVSEESAVELIDEYKQKCKEKHHDLDTYYKDKEPFLMKTLKKLKIKDDETFEEYKYSIYQNDLAQCEKMEEILEKLQQKEKVIDYKEIFKDIKDDFKYVETHMFDSVFISLMPLDCVVYNFSEKLLDIILKMDSLCDPILVDEKNQIYYTNMVFCKNEEVFSVIATESGMILMLLKEDEYKEFKKLKIRHTPGEVYEED